MQLYNSICVIIIKQIKTQHKKNVDVNSKLCLINELLKYNIYMCAHTHTHTHIYIYIYIYKIQNGGLVVMTKPD